MGAFQTDHSHKGLAMSQELGRLATLNILSPYQLYKYFISQIFSHLKIISCSIPSEFTKLIGYPDEKNTYTLHMQPGIEASVLMLLEQKNQKKFESNPQVNWTTE